ncbi:MAG: helix-turn-helix transcriptional regulator [Bacteroidota bacterium]
MIDRILLILKTQNLSSSQFADEIGVQRSSISHILSGRNNPSLEFVTKILKRYPDINSDWIIFGKGSMYKGSDAMNEAAPKEIKKTGLQPDLFNFAEVDQVEIKAVEAATLDENPKYQAQNEESPIEKDSIIPEIQAVKDEIKLQKKNIKIEEENEIPEKAKELQNIKKTIEKIVIFYTDRTFREYFTE